jgi:APA family basic amino acid/polyamine antiporter
VAAWALIPAHLVADDPAGLAHPEEMAEPEPALARTLGFAQVTAGGVGIIIGAGIYVLIGEAAREAGAAVWASFAIAAALCLFTGLSYAEMASMFPTAAAEYDYARRAFPEVVAFFVGWIMAAGLIVAAGAVALGFGRYAGQFIEIDARLAALCLLGALLAFGATGIRQSGLLILLLSLIQVGGLLAVIVIGAPHIGDRSLSQSNGAAGIIGAASLVFFAFIGFDEVITLGEETRDPTRTIPRALLASLGISALLYAAIAVTAVSVLGAEALGASARPMADVVERAAGERAAGMVAVAALLSTMNTTLLALTAGSRLIYGMASQGALPGLLSRVTRTTRVPLVSLVLASVGAAAVAAVGDLALVAQITDFSVYLVFVAVNGAVIVLRFRQPSTARPIRSPWAVRRVPLLPLAGLASVALLLSRLDLSAVLVGLALGLVGLIAGLALDSRSPLRRRRATAGSQRSADL